MSEQPEARDPLTGGDKDASARNPGDLGARELLRWTWRQLTSMRTALVLLLLLAVAAIPGSVIPQRSVDAIATSQWQDAHPDLTPIYNRLGLFAVYDSPWFAAIYLLLMISLVGCILPRLGVYWRALRQPPPLTPRNLVRLADHASYTTDEAPDVVLERAQAALKGHRVRALDDSLSAERGHLREAGNLLFHLALLVVLVGFAVGSMFGYKGGVIIGVGHGFANNLTQYDDFDPGSLFDPEVMEPFCLTVDDFEAEWLYTGRQAGMANKFVAPITYREDCLAGDEKSYDLRVNHPLSIGGTDLFLIGHGYAPVITVRDGNGDIAYRGATTFLPTDPQTFRSFGVVKVPDARPTSLGLTGEFYPTYDFDMERGPYSRFGEALNPKIVLTAYTGDLGLDTGLPQSVYTLRTESMDPVLREDGQMFRIELAPGEEVELPDGLGTVSFDSYEEWTRLQISRTPAKFVALGGAVMALLGLMLSLFVRPRRLWVRARREEEGTLVEVAGLDRSGGGDVADEVARIIEALQAPKGTP